jgi:rubrerythrin
MIWKNLLKRMKTYINQDIWECPECGLIVSGYFEACPCGKMRPRKED